MQCWNREDGERRRNHRRERRRGWNNVGGVRRRQCSAGTEKMEKGGEIIKKEKTVLEQ